MSEAVFNTLLAVAQMCTGHLQGAFTITTGSQQSHWEKGFEQCETVQKSVEGEQKRRAIAASSEQEAHDKARLKNALAAIHGDGFAPEPAPPQLKLSPPFGCAYINTSAKP